MPFTGPWRKRDAAVSQNGFIKDDRATKMECPLVITMCTLEVEIPSAVCKKRPSVSGLGSAPCEYSRRIHVIVIAIGIVAKQRREPSIC